MDTHHQSQTKRQKVDDGLPTGLDGTLRCLTLEPHLEEGLLEKKNAHPFDEYIWFQEEGHIYAINGDRNNLKSSTGYIHGFFNEFDSKSIIGRIVGCTRWHNDPDYKYYQMCAESIQDMWDQNGKEASSLGTIMHAAIEYYYNGLESIIKPETLATKEYSVLFQQYRADHPDLIMYRTEWMIFSKILRITGSIDGVARNPDGTLTLIDWKRSKEIKSKGFGNKKGKNPFSHMPDCNKSHYTLQLNLYRSILETFYGEIVSETYLVILHPQQDRYQKILIPRLDLEAELLFEVRRTELMDQGLLPIQDNHYHFKTREDLFDDDGKPIFPQNLDLSNFCNAEC